MYDTLPFSPPDTVPIGNSGFHIHITDHRYYYFLNIVPTDSHASDNRRAMLLRIGRFGVENGISQRELMDAFGVCRRTVARAKRCFREGGEAEFEKPRRGRGPSKFSPDLAEKATALLEAGESGAGVARRLGISVSSINKWRREGRIGNRAGVGKPGGVSVARSDAVETKAASAAPESVEASAVTASPAGAVGKNAELQGTDRSARDRRDRQGPMGRAACDVVGRVLASRGAGPVAPQFLAPAKGVRCGGVLTALPAVLKEGLLAATDTLPQLRNGYYGLPTILLFLTFMTLARVRNPEGLHVHAPGEWGAILGLDRGPAVKTLRQKIRCLASGDMEKWQSALAGLWWKEAPDLTLAVDGHVKVYSGRKGRLPKGFVSRQKLCLPTSASYWLNVLGGKPLLCLHKELDPRMVAALEADVAPALQELGIVDDRAEDLTGEEPGHPALTLVFDREGWSPALFLRLARRGIACMTWHKNFRGEDWPTEDFAEMTVPLHGPATEGKATVRLAEKPVTLSNGFRVRQIRRLLDNGRQVPMILTDPHKPIHEAAGAMFSRWSQENFFKYMRNEFNLDALPTHELERLPPDTKVPNPQWRRWHRKVRRIECQLMRLRNRIADAKRKRTKAKLESEVKELQDTLECAREIRRSLPTHCLLGDLGEADQLDALPSGQRLFLDLIRMIAYRAETTMMLPIVNGQDTNTHPRRLLQALMTADADILPDHANGILRVQILGLGNDACDRQIQRLLDELNATRTTFPGTTLQMVYEIPKSPESPQSVQTQTVRGQDV